MPNRWTLPLKEFRQNALIFTIPYLFLWIVWVANRHFTHWLTPQWVQILGAVLPVALAGAYGLQAFDAEENTQTRDFLLTKPLSSFQITGSKYFPGLLMLLIFNYCWQMALQPESLRLPDVFDLSSLWFTSFVIILTGIYNVSFVTGLLIKGPQKLLVALFSVTILTGWWFEGWCEAITAVYWAGWGLRAGFLSTLLVLALSIGLITIISLSSIYLTSWRLSGATQPQYCNQLYCCLGALLILPILLFAHNTVSPSPIRPFNHLAFSFFEKEPWFITVKAYPQPNGPTFACIDSTGRIGLTQGSAKPRVITRPKANVKVTQLTWSGDGRFFSYDENGTIKTYQLATGKVSTVIQGEQAFWSNDNAQLLVSQITKTQTLEQNGIKVPYHTIKFTLFDRKSNAPVSWVQLSSIPTRAFEWDSVRGQILAFDRSWSLKILDLKDKKVQTVNFLATLPEYELITWSQIIHSQVKPARYQLVVTSVDRQTFAKRRPRINLRWYTFNPETRQIQLKATLRGLNATLIDLVVDTAHHRLLSNNGNGVYSATALNPEVK